jgi:hypothetical protein
MAIGLMSWMPAQAQESRWAAADESTAKSLIDYERQWAEAGCTHDGIQKTILAEDFYGTAPDGSRYSKKKELADAQSGVREEVCTKRWSRTAHPVYTAMRCTYADLAKGHSDAGFPMVDFSGAPPPFIVVSPGDQLRFGCCGPRQ